MLRYAFLFLIPLIAHATADDYIAKMIACDEKNERFVTQAFDAFLSALETRQIKKGELEYPVAMVEKTGDSIVISRAFYVSPNELHGFELTISRDCFVELEGRLALAVDVVVTESQTRQGITSMLFKRKPNQAPEPTTTLVTPRADARVAPSAVVAHL